MNRQRNEVFVALIAIACSSCCLPLEKVELTQASWAQELGYGASDTVLVLHADDAGMLPAANDAIEESLAAGEIDSTSVMMPIDTSVPFLQWAAANPGHDVGLHLTITSEFDAKRWGPMAPSSSVASLVDATGNFHKSGPLGAKARHVKREIRAQIDAALAAGLEPSHLDSHMGSLFLRPDIFRAYVCAAVDYDIPPVLFEDYAKTLECLGGQDTIISNQIDEALQTWVTALTPRSPFPRLDAYCGVPKGDTLAEVTAAFLQRVDDLGPGLYQFLFHPAKDDLELQQLTGSWEQRVFEDQLFEQQAVKDLFAEPDVFRTNWTRIRCRWECQPCPDDPDPWTSPPRCP